MLPTALSRTGNPSDKYNNKYVFEGEMYMVWMLLVHRSQHR